MLKMSQLLWKVEKGSVVKGTLLNFYSVHSYCCLIVSSVSYGLNYPRSYFNPLPHFNWSVSSKSFYSNLSPQTSPTPRPSFRPPPLLWVCPSTLLSLKGSTSPSGIGPGRSLPFVRTSRFTPYVSGKNGREWEVGVGGVGRRILSQERRQTSLTCLGRTWSWIRSSTDRSTSSWKCN